MAESHRDEIAKLETLYASNPDGRVFTHLAEAYRRAGELDRARELLERGLRRHQDYASAHVVLGRVLADQGLESEATTSFRRVLELDPENLIARRALAESDRAAGRETDALVHYRELLAHDPSDDGLRAIISELESRAAPASAAPPPPAWSPTPAEESWEAGPQPPLSLEPTSFGGADAPAEPSAQEPLSLDSVSFGEPLDLGSVDFGGEQPLSPEAGLSLGDFGLGPAQSEPPASSPSPPAAGAAPAPDDEHGWGEWPGAAQPASAAEVPPPESAAPRPLTPEAAPEPVEPELLVPEPLTPDAVPVAAEPELLAPEPPATEGAAPDEPLREYAELADAPMAAEPPREAAPALGGAEPPGAPPVEAEPAVEQPPAERGGAPEPSATAAEPPSEAAEGGPVAAEPGSVATETLASLYRAQGFPDRAAAVYRELLRQRPGDAELEERARAAEAEAEAMQATRTGVDEARDVWVSGAPDTWDVDARVSTAHGWGEQEPDAEHTGGPSISEYFQRILTWRAGHVPTAAAEPIAAAVAPEPLPVHEPEAVAARAPAPEREAEPVEPEPEPFPAQRFEAEPEQAVLEEEHATEAMHAAGEQDREVPSDGSEGEFAGAGPFTFGEQAPPDEEWGVTAPEPPADTRAAASSLDMAPEAPMVFAGEQESAADAPQAYTFEEESEDATAEPLPYVFETGADEHIGVVPDEDAAEAPSAFALDGWDGSAPDMEGAAFGFEADLDMGTSGEGEEDESVPFVLEPIDAGEEEDEPLPFELDFTGSAEDRDYPAAAAREDAGAGEPSDVPAAEVEPEYPWAVTDDWSAAGESRARAEGRDAGTGEMLFLEETEAVAEPPATEPDAGWDPTIALADVAPVRRPGGGRDAPPARPASPTVPPAEEDEDEDLEMFRSWLQSLKR